MIGDGVTAFYLTMFALPTAIVIAVVVLARVLGRRER
jgi:hypothetical protein